MNKLTDTLELWLQEQINTCCMGLFDRIDRLERENLQKDNEIRDLYRQVENQDNAMVKRIEDLEAGLVECRDMLVERTPDEQLSSFTDRVCEVFDTEELKTTVEEIIAAWVADSDGICSPNDVVSILEDATFTIQVR